ncbi:C39 family peptidase [Massilioclostridium coli]|uniref:C39 family peptidase n=1 Tax=Massilioclostridium coli TaxID=1870991 RepID=UPI0009F37306|nr:C39 family peptidase [Massilioclostridium coli]
MKKGSTKYYLTAVLSVLFVIITIAVVVFNTGWVSSKNNEYFLQNTNHKTEKCLSVPYMNQSDEYPTGCEIVSAAMVLQYYQYDIPVNQLIDCYLDKQEIWSSGGKLYGGNPNEVFVGDPRNSNSYGCYAPVITNMLNQVLTNHTAKTLNNISLEKLANDYISKGQPVLVWVTIDMKSSYEGTKIYQQDGSTFQWIAPEHCMVFIGYDEESYYFNDPYQNHGVVQYPKELVQQRYQEMQQQAVIVTPN